MKKILVAIATCLLLVSCNTETPKNNTLTSNTTDTMIDQTAPLKKWDIVATMKTTNGTFVIKLFTDAVPKTALNFIGLAQQGYYDGIIFHRIIPGFMIQGGDPEGTGRGGTSYYGANFEDEFHPELKNIPGSLSMANAGPNTNGSQFFINQVDNSFLNNKHSVFGQVVEGNDNIDKIAKVKTGSGDKPVKDVKIISIKIGEYTGAKIADTTIDVEAELKKSESKQVEANKAKQEANKDRAVKAEDTIAVHYTGTHENGEKFDSSHDRGTPLEFSVWSGQMIPGFDAAVVGMKVWDKKSITLSPEEAYGTYDETRVQELPRTELSSFEEAGIALEVWAELPSQQWVFKIVAVSDDTISIDVNHPLAGKTLKFEVELVEFKN